MENLVLHPNTESQMHALVQDARQIATIPLSEELESYLVFLLTRYLNHPEIVKDVLALDFLHNVNYLNDFGKKNKQGLREVGDKCLLFSGLFPLLARRRRVKMSYYVALGKSAYFSLSEFKNHELSELFLNLCEQFVALMDILQTIRSLDKNYQWLDLLGAYELWAETQSTHALKIIKAASNPNSLFIQSHSLQSRNNLSH